MRNSLKKEVKLSQSKLKEILHYDPDTGIFTWRVSLSRRVRVGSIAGHIADDGSIRIVIDYNTYLANRLAYLYVTGIWPEPNSIVIHINGNPRDNRKLNLIKSSQTRNFSATTLFSHNTTGYNGVTEHAGYGDFAASYTTTDGSVHLGYHKDPKRASVHYRTYRMIHNTTPMDTGMGIMDLIPLVPRQDLYAELSLLINEVTDSTKPGKLTPLFKKIDLITEAIKLDELESATVLSLLDPIEGFRPFLISLPTIEPFLKIVLDGTGTVKQIRSITKTNVRALINGSLKNKTTSAIILRKNIKYSNEDTGKLIRLAGEFLVNYRAALNELGLDENHGMLLRSAKHTDAGLVISFSK